MEGRITLNAFVCAIEGAIMHRGIGDAGILSIGSGYDNNNKEEYYVIRLDNGESVRVSLKALEKENVK